MMNLTPTELERLTIFSAAELARKRRAKGLRLSYVEAIAYITDEVLEGAREGRDAAHHRRRAARRRRARFTHRRGRSLRGRQPAHRDLFPDPAREASGVGGARQPR